MRFHRFHPRHCPAARSRGAGFTLVEIMIVIAIMGVVLATSIPMVWKAFNKNEMAKAVNDIVEGCKAARDRAILHGVPYQFVVHNEGELNVVPAPVEQKENSPEGMLAAPARPPVQATGSLMGAFPRKLGENVAVRLIDVNFVDHMKMPEARVRFYPNGTSDEFTIVLMEKGIQRIITLDIITGLAREITP